MVGYGNGWLKVKRWFLLLLTGASLYGAPPFEAVPWTKNFLEIRPTLVLERLSATPRHRRLPAHSPEQAFHAVHVLDDARHQVARSAADYAHASCA